MMTNKAPMYAFVVLVAVAIVGLNGCGGGGGGSSSNEPPPPSVTFDFASLSNGTTESKATSVWRCTVSVGDDYSFVIFGDGTGKSTAIGDFTWLEISPGVISILAGASSQTISDIQSTPDFGTISFTGVSDAIPPPGSIFIPQVSTCSRPPTDKPALRGGSPAAFDSRNGTMIVLDGAVEWGALALTTLRETWAFNGLNWRKIDTAEVPSGSVGAMTYDPVRQKTVLVSYITTSTGRTTETWEFDGANWEKRITVNKPPTRSEIMPQRMVYDQTRGVAVLISGESIGPSEIWQYDGTDWTQVFSRSTYLGCGSLFPCNRYWAIAYDIARSVVVYLGGESDLTNTIWHWNGSSWTQEATTSPRLVSSFLSLIYDNSREVVVLNDSWISEWDGISLTNASARTGWKGQSMVYDSVNARVLIFGGHISSGSNAGQVTNQLWFWDGSVLSQ